MKFGGEKYPQTSQLNRSLWPFPGSSAGAVRARGKFKRHVKWNEQAGVKRTRETKCKVVGHMWRKCGKTRRSVLPGVVQPEAFIVRNDGPQLSLVLWAKATTSIVSSLAGTSARLPTD